MPRRCVSTCKQRPIDDCRKTYRCSYTNGEKRKFCRLSSKYKMNKQTCNVTRRFTKKTAASRIQRFVRSRRNRTAKRIQLESVEPVKPVAVSGPTTPEIREFTNKVHAKRLVRFMNKVDPHKRRSVFLNGVCSDAGVCIAFGKETATIKKHFDGFVQFRHLAIPAKRIGTVSVNGFVKELTYERSGYSAHAILKSSALAKGDNLYYEYLVGLFINKRALQFPCFVETYEMFQYKNDETYQKMKNHTETSASVIEGGLVPYSSISRDIQTQLAMSCKSSIYASLLIQHIKNAQNLASKCSSIAFVRHDLLNVLFQIYMPLSMMCDKFTHYDLHVENVLVYEPVENSYIQYHYHMKDGSVVSFCSSYIAKIIDYGRSFFNDTENNGIDGSSKKIYDTICDKSICDRCGDNQGFQWLAPNANKEEAKTSYHISSTVSNCSHDLRILHMIAKYSRKKPKNGFEVMSSNVDYYTNKLFKLCKKVKYEQNFGTPNMANSGLPKQINNVTDACIALQEMIGQPDNQRDNATFYSHKTKKKLGDMHVHSDGSPLRFVASV